LNTPAKHLEGNRRLAISSDISIEFSRPILDARFWARRFSATWMAMPETTVHEDCYSPSRKYQIGCSGQVTPMKSIAQPAGVGSSPYADFRSGVFAGDPRHQPGAPFRRKPIRHLFHSAATAWIFRSSNFDLMANKTARAIRGDTLFPIILKECHTAG
jgi:hypothetical protein